MSTAELVDSQVAFSPLLRQYTLGEFWELPEPPDRWHYDLIGGVLYKGETAESRVLTGWRVSVERLFADLV